MTTTIRPRAAGAARESLQVNPFSTRFTRPGAVPPLDTAGRPLDIVALLDRADEAVAISRQVEKKRSILRGRTQINLFYEPSTRTQASFEIAGKRLGADVVNMHAAQSSVKKGETLIDTAQTLNAMRAVAIDFEQPICMLVGLLNHDPERPPQQSPFYGVRIIEPVLDAMGIDPDKYKLNMRVIGDTATVTSDGNALQFTAPESGGGTKKETAGAS